MSWRLGTLAVCLALSGCGDDDPAVTGDPVSLRFAGRVGGEDFECGGTYAQVGTSESTFTGGDLRFYVSNVRLLSGDVETPVTLDQDGTWQTSNVALLDFEDGTGPCQSGNTEQNDTVRGRAPAGEYDGVRFELGVPFELNHNDAAIAPSPLSLTSMFWGWQAGYKFLRVDGSSSMLESFNLHVASTGCHGGPPDGVTGCDQPNRPTVTLTGFDPETGIVVADLAQLLADTDIDVNGAGPALCMSGPSDTDCGSIFGHLGLEFAGAPAGSQSFFRAE